MQCLFLDRPTWFAFCSGNVTNRAFVVFSWRRLLLKWFFGNFDRFLGWVDFYIISVEKLDEYSCRNQPYSIFFSQDVVVFVTDVNFRESLLTPFKHFDRFPSNFLL